MTRISFSFMLRLTTEGVSSFQQAVKQSFGVCLWIN